MAKPIPIRIVILGESGVGKTSFADKVLHGVQYHRYDPFQSSQDADNATLQVDGETYSLHIDDVSLTLPRIREFGLQDAIFIQLLKKASGIVLLYDITNEDSYKHVTEFGWKYVWGCRAEGTVSGGKYYVYPTGKLPLLLFLSKRRLRLAGHQRFGCVLVGNKLDLVQGQDADKRAVPKDLAEEWASMVGVESFEVDRFDRIALEASLRDLIRSALHAQRRDREDIQVVKARQDAGAQTDKKQKQKSGRFPSLSKLRKVLPRGRLNSDKET